MECRRMARPESIESFGGPSLRKSVSREDLRWCDMVDTLAVTAVRGFRGNRGCFSKGSGASLLARVREGRVWEVVDRFEDEFSCSLEGWTVRALRWDCRCCEAIVG